MVEILLPTGATIAAFVMSVISWYGTLRAGYQAAYLDSHTIRSVFTDKISMEEGLDQQKELFTDFQKRWLIFSANLPPELYEKLWGPVACAKIKKLFENIETRSTQITDKVNSWQLAGKSEPKKGKKRYLGFLSSKNPLGDVKFVIAEKLFVEDCLRKLAGDISLVANAAKRGYQKTRRFSGSKDDVPEEEIHSSIIGYLLVDLANRWRGDAELFASSLLQIRPSFFVELELSEITGTAPNRRQVPAKVAQAISVVQTAAAERLKLTMLAGPKFRQDMNPVRVSVERLKDLSSTSHPDCHAALHHFLRNNSPCDYSADANTHIQITLSSVMHQPNDGLRLSLRKIPSLLWNLSESSDRPRQEVELAKYRAVFELSQTYLIFLRTRCLHSLCSCHLRFGKVKDPSDYEFSLSMADDEHILHPSAQAYERDPWCQHAQATNLDPNLCLGILLAEITLGVYVIPNNNPYTGKQVYFVGVGQQDNWKVPCTFEGLRRRLRDLSDKEISRGAIRRTADYADAIMYCFENSAPALVPEDGTSNHLGEFYLRVVAK